MKRINLRQARRAESDKPAETVYSNHLGETITRQQYHETYSGQAINVVINPDPAMSQDSEFALHLREHLRSSSSRIRETFRSTFTGGQQDSPSDFRYNTRDEAINAAVQWFKRDRPNFHGAARTPGNWHQPCTGRLRGELTTVNWGIVSRESTRVEALMLFPGENETQNKPFVVGHRTEDQKGFVFYDEIALAATARNLVSSQLNDLGVIPEFYDGAFLQVTREWEQTGEDEHQLTYTCFAEVATVGQEGPTTKIMMVTASLEQNMYDPIHYGPSAMRVEVSNFGFYECQTGAFEAARMAVADLLTVVGDTVFKLLRMRQRDQERAQKVRFERRSSAKSRRDEWVDNEGDRAVTMLARSLAIF